ncbi:MAG: hypothetical protein K2H98_02410 [Duncaniella sp.]|nr:hypothetical protein [Duncaniella sp.]
MRDLFVNTTQTESGDKPSDQKRPDDPNKDRSVQVRATCGRYFERRVKSELALEEELPWHFDTGMAYHCFSFGDVDSLTYLRAIIKQQPVEYVLISTWCMAATDVEEIKKWIRRGDLKHIDLYVGEIFQASYASIYLMLAELVKEFGGRVAIFRNHSKVMAGFGSRFDFVIESSANVNTNPRSEATVITVDTGLARWYKEEIFDKIQSFNHDFDGWKPYKLKRDETI